MRRGGFVVEYALDNRYAVDTVHLLYIVDCDHEVTHVALTMRPTRIAPSELLRFTPIASGVGPKETLVLLADIAGSLCIEHAGRRTKC